jgi:hypothetical protein
MSTNPPTFPLNEKTSSEITGQLQDETGAGVPAASLTSFTLTLYDLNTGQILNSRNAQNVLNANGVTVDSNGNVVWTLSPADNAIVTDALGVETHIALFQWTWAGGLKGANVEVAIPVRNLAKVS